MRLVDDFDDSLQGRLLRRVRDVRLQLERVARIIGPRLRRELRPAPQPLTLLTERGDFAQRIVALACQLRHLLSKRHLLLLERSKLVAQT